MFHEVSLISLLEAVMYYKVCIYSMKYNIVYSMKYNIVYSFLITRYSSSFSTLVEKPPWIKRDKKGAVTYELADTLLLRTSCKSQADK